MTKSYMSAPLEITTWPGPCLFEARAPCLGVEPPQLGRPAHLGLEPLRRADMGFGEQLRQPCPRILAVGLLAAIAAGGDHDLALAGHPTAGELLQAREDVRRNPEPIDIDAQLHRGRDLVDVLAARPPRG